MSLRTLTDFAKEEYFYLTPQTTSRFKLQSSLRLKYGGHKPIKLQHCCQTLFSVLRTNTRDNICSQQVNCTATNGLVLSAMLSCYAYECTNMRILGLVYV